MRLTGSFHTIVTHGESGTAFSSVSGRSTSAGATLTAVHLPSTYPPRRPPVCQDRTVPATSAASGPERARCNEGAPAAGNLELQHEPGIRSIRCSDSSTRHRPPGFTRHADDLLENTSHILAYHASIIENVRDCAGRRA